MAWGSIGSFAGLVFTVSSWRVLTPDNISGSTSSNWATHSVIGGKDKSEYVSPGLREYQFNITLSSRLGVNPRKVFDPNGFVRSRSSRLLHHQQQAGFSKSVYA